MDQLSEIEKLYMAKEGLEGLPHLSPDMIRNSMKRVAYHEAGHFAARYFTMLEFSHVTEVSIIGNDTSTGYVRSERNFTESGLESYPTPLKRSNGYMLLIGLLAGYGAEAILDKSEEWESVFDYYEATYSDLCFEMDIEGGDYNRALRIAEIMARPFMPVNRVLNIADRWIIEILNIPSMWNIVEIVADRLIKVGKIKGEACEALKDMILCQDFPTAFRLPKWSKRLLPKPGDMEQYIERV